MTATQAERVPVSGGLSPPVSSGMPLNPGIEAQIRLLRLDRGFYSLSLLQTPGRRPGAADVDLPLVHVGTPGSDEKVEMRDLRGRQRSWLSAVQTRLFLRVPPTGVRLVLTAYDTGSGEDPPLELEVRRLDPGLREPMAANDPVAFATPSSAESAPTATPIVVLSLTPPAADIAAGIEVAAHIRGEGEVRFLGTRWAGRLGQGAWLSAFVLITPEHLPQFQIEYRGLAASGAETPWIAGGSLCAAGSTDAPLVGFAVRRRTSPESAFFDCVYSGYFQSGAIVGPSRNGAPCRSPLPNDPLEGLQVRIAERPSRSGR